MVALAIPTLIGFGLWQLQRAEWKEALLAEYAANSRAPLLDLGSGPIPDDAQFRSVRVAITCPPGPPIVRAGRNQAGQIGYSHIARCRVGSTPVLLDSYWAPRPSPDWFGAEDDYDVVDQAQGILVRQSSGEWLLVLAPSQSAQESSAPPGIDTIPNNHRSYAVQWFSFALILAIIYALYVRRWRLAAHGDAA
jgi:cytochrome oxidase assembly protein ShyY1